MPTSDELRDVQTQLATLTAAVERMEKAMSAYTSLDKDVGIVQLKQAHTTDAITHMRERVEQHAAACLRADEIIHKRVDEIGKDTASFQARATGGFYVVCGIGAVVISICTWALAQITKNTETNIEQNQRIVQMEKSFADVQQRLVAKGEVK